MEIDLHGYTIHEAWNLFRGAVSEAYYDSHRSLTIITGQGAMMREFPTWAQNHPHIRQVTQHKHNPGSWSVKLRKKKNA